MPNTLHRLRAIGRSCLCLSLAAAAIVHAEPMLKLTWTVDDKTTTQTIPLPTPGKVAELGKMAQRPHEATSGDCSRFDTSAIARSYPEGDALLVSSSALNDEGAIVQVQFEVVRFDSVSTTTLARNCMLKFASTRRIATTPQAFLRFGQSVPLLNSRDEQRVTKLEAELLR
jgi:hypothetical protein